MIACDPIYVDVATPMCWKLAVWKCSWRTKDNTMWLWLLVSSRSAVESSLGYRSGESPTEYGGDGKPTISSTKYYTPRCSTATLTRKNPEYICTYISYIPGMDGCCLRLACTLIVHAVYIYILRVGGKGPEADIEAARFCRDRLIDWAS